jgi:phosphate transport system ATP-binding protein
MGTQRPHISVRNLNVHYGKEHALKDVDLDVPNQQITAIIGPSGCGKTTLLKCFNRLIDLSDEVKITGEVLVDGINIYGRSKVDVTEMRQKMGLLFQRPYPLPMSIYDNVAYGPRIHGMRNRKKLDQIVEHYLKVAGLWDEVQDRLKSPASKMSIGQQQRLCLARGLAVEPECILCDEPTSALDPISAERIERRLLELKEQYTIVLVTHTLRQARRLADYVVFFYLGELVEKGPTHQVFDRPVDPRTKAYIEGVFLEQAEDKMRE